MPELAILVPSVHRAEKLPALVENIAEVTETPHRIYLIVENSDRSTCQKLWELKGDHLVVFGNFGSAAKAFNAGFEGSTESLVFLANDDCKFSEGWELPALLALEEDGKHVCGVNDGHGRLTSFALVRRSYIEEHSGVFDKPGTLCHPYESQYVDTELAEYAKHRGVWTEAEEGGVIHEHWEWGLADPNHKNYVKAKETCASDHQTFQHRREQWIKTPASAS